MNRCNNNVITITVVVSLALGLMGPMSALAASPAAINLGSSGNFAILAKTGVSTTGSTSIIGDVGLSPAAASYLTGFALTLPAASAFSTSALVTGKLYAPGYADPTPANLTMAVLDMQTAYVDGLGRAPDVTELGAGAVGGMTLAPGVYKWSTGLTIPTDVTLVGSANDVWIFQVAQNLTVSSAARVILAGGAQARNVFWVVAGQTILGTTSVVNGTILDQTSIILNTGAQLNGRALAQAAVTLDANVVTTVGPAAAPTPVTPSSTSTPTQTPTPAPTYSYTYVAPVPTTSASSNQNIALQAQLNGLLQTLYSLQAQQSGQQSTPSNSSMMGQQVRAIAVSLTVGSKSSNVTTLQQFLIAQQKGPAARALAANGATIYFGALTRAALAEFQASAGISPASGYFGALTRAYISTHY